jgi:hypothetical protein
MMARFTEALCRFTAGLCRFLGRGGLSKSVASGKIVGMAKAEERLMNSRVRATVPTGVNLWPFERAATRLRATAGAGSAGSSHTGMSWRSNLVTRKRSGTRCTDLPKTCADLQKVYADFRRFDVWHPTIAKIVCPLTMALTKRDREGRRRRQDARRTPLFRQGRSTQRP